MRTAYLCSIIAALGSTMCGGDPGAVVDGGGDATVASDIPTAPDGDTAGPSDEVHAPELNASPTTTGTEFWVGFMENLSLASNGPPTFAFFVSAEEHTIGHVEVPQTGYSQAFEVGAGEVVKVTMPAGILYPQIDELPSKLGVHITADLPVSVVAVHYRIYFSEASRVLPVGELGDEYVAVTAVDIQHQSPSSLVVVATEDDTTIEVTPSTVTTGFLPTGVTQRFELERGQTIQFQAGDDLSGTRVHALGGKRIAVFAGARQAHIACVGADSHLWDQMIPTARWGTRYVVMPLAGSGATPVKVVADRFKTSVDISCQGSALINPGRGQTLSIAKASVLASNQPIGVAVLTKSEACMTAGTGDPNLLVVPPLGLVSRSVAWTAFDDFETLVAARHWVTILTAASSQGDLRLDGMPVPGLAPLEGVPELVWAAVEVPAGTHRIDGGPTFQAMMHGLGMYEAYTFGAGWGCDPASGDGNVKAGSCAGLGTPAVPEGCDPGDLRLSSGTPVDPGDPGGKPTCENACQCYGADPHPAIECSGDERPIWTCDHDCKPACGSPCMACAERFPRDAEGRCL
ncbi:MAG: IgGFc-binding protein [Myxococcota bacterium]